MHRRSDKALDDLARMFNSHILLDQLLWAVLSFDSLSNPSIHQILARWAAGKFKSLRGHKRRSRHWLARMHAISLGFRSLEPALWAQAAEQWEPDDARVSRPVLRERGRNSSRHSSSRRSMVAWSTSSGPWMPRAKCSNVVSGPNQTQQAGGAQIDAQLLKKYGFVPDKLVTDDLRFLWGCSQ